MAQVEFDHSVPGDECLHGGGKTLRDGMGSEDFPFLVEGGAKGLYYNVGGTPKADLDAAKAGGPPVAGHHSPLFKVDGEGAVKTGSATLTAAVLELLAKPKS